MLNSSASYRDPTCLHDIEENLLAQTVLSLKELMLRICPRNVSPDQFFTRRRHL